MLQVSPGALPRYKRRMVFSIRHFPIGCGPRESKSGPGETSSQVVLENGKLTDTDNASGSAIGCKEPVIHLVLKDENPDDMDDMEELPCSMMCVLLENDAAANPSNGKNEAREIVREKPDSSKLQDGRCYSKVYGTPKRRKLSAMRQFPPGCGSSSGSNRDNLLQPSCAGHTLPKSKSLVGKKMDGGSDNLVQNEIIVGQMRKITGVEVEVILETGQETHSDLGIRPHTASQWKNKKPALKQQEMGGCLALLPSTENYLHDMEIAPFVEQPLVIDSSPRVGSTETNLNCKKSIVKQAAAVAIFKKERVRVGKRNDSDVTKGKERNISESNFVGSNDGKDFYGRGTQGTSGHVQIKLSTKSASSVHLVHSVPRKMLEGCKDDQSVKNLQIKENAISPSHESVESKFASKLLNKEGRQLLGKRSLKENEFTLKSSNSLKINLSGEILYKDHIPDEVDDSLEAHGDRMIIQALMDAKNCPRRNFKIRGADGYISAIPKIEIKERGLAARSSTSKDLSSSRKKNKSSIDGDDYMLGEQKNWREHRMFQKSNELNVIQTPFVLSKLSQKDGDNIEILARRRVKRVLRLFQLICRKLLQHEESSLKRLGKFNRIDLHASNMLKKNNELVNYGGPILGNVPGVEIGDEFHYRVELSIIGLHRLYQGGIDSMKQNGMLVAVSIVASGGYHDEMDGSDVLIYSGSGGNSVGADKQPEDQKLERGNLALKNSIDAQSPVRVIYGFKEKSDDHDSKGKLVSTFTYAGLYHVESYWQERSPKGSNVFKFQLKRKAGQPELAIKELKLLTKLKIRHGLCINDISLGKEKVPVSVINTIDTDLPMLFKYITKNIYPSCYASIPPRGCNCFKGCSDSENCACAAKNGGEIPYNFSGSIVQAKPLIYECGPSCKCPPSCYNRVGQHGFRIQLEVFKTKGRGWGVRSLKSISSGSFICEYIGELLLDGEAEQRANDEYLFDIGQNYDDQPLLDGLPYLKELQSTSACDTVENVGFTIDAAEYGNIGRFINHSCSPNLYAQNVLYDHDDKRMPHIMFFAVDNIPPLQELTYHYNYKMDQVHDSEGNIKQKACHCGSSECRGRLY